MPQDIRYATFVWLFSVTLGPILLFFVLALLENRGFADLSESLSFMRLAFLMGLVLSIPCWLVFMLLVRFVSRAGGPITQQKVYIQVGAIVIGMAPFALLFGERFIGTIAFAMPYLISLSIGIWSFRLHNNTPPPALDPTDHLIDS